jgi:hypothetical protein
MSEFKPHLCQCAECDSVLQSAYPGQFVQCQCGMSFVDQTPHYSRYGGNARSVEQLILQDLKTITGVGYEKEDVLILLAEITDTDILAQYIMTRGELGGSSFSDLVEAGRGHKVFEYLDAIREGY